MSEQEIAAVMAFPRDVEIKAMGATSDDFVAIVVRIIRQFVTDIKESAISIKQSSGGQFTSVTVHFHTDSKQTLDAIYQALIDHEQVKYIL